MQLPWLDESQGRRDDIRKSTGLLAVRAAAVPRYFPHCRSWTAPDWTDLYFQTINQLNRHGRWDLRQPRSNQSTHSLPSKNIVLCFFVDRKLTRPVSAASVPNTRCVTLAIGARHLITPRVNRASQGIGENLDQLINLLQDTFENVRFFTFPTASRVLTQYPTEIIANFLDTNEGTSKMYYTCILCTVQLRYEKKKKHIDKKRNKITL